MVRKFKFLLVIAAAAGGAVLLLAQASLPTPQVAIIQEAKLTPSDGVAQDAFGFSVALSGDMALVGTPNKDNYRGAVYVFVRSGSIWTQQAKLVGSDGSSFGFSVALSGNTALIGAHTDTTASSGGAAYVFVRSGSQWSQQAKLVEPLSTFEGGLGRSAALEGDTAVIGALGSHGAVYVFVRSGNTWTQQARFNGHDIGPDSNFGNSLDLSGNTALIGDWGDYGQKGAAYVFVRSGSSWTEQAKLLASDGELYDRFGTSVALLGNFALIGAPQTNAFRGSAYVFVRSGTTWTQRANLRSPSGSDTAFASSVALGRRTALFSAGSQVPGRSVVYVQLRGASSHVKLEPSDGEFLDAFGSSMALNGDTALIAATGASSGAGAVYVFRAIP